MHFSLYFWSFITYYGPKDSEINLEDTSAPPPPGVVPYGYDTLQVSEF